jgi:hypothetical protein
MLECLYCQLHSSEQNLTKYIFHKNHIFFNSEPLFQVQSYRQNSFSSRISEYGPEMVEICKATHNFTYQIFLYSRWIVNPIITEILTVNFTHTKNEEFG